MAQSCMSGAASNAEAPTPYQHLENQRQKASVAGL